MLPVLFVISTSLTAIFQPISHFVLRRNANPKLLKTPPFLHGIELDVSSPAYGTPFADLYKGVWCKLDIAAKRLRIFDKEERERLHALLIEKALVWQKLEHPNILPFYGLDDSSLKPFMCLIVLWVKRGNALQYLALHQDVSIKSILTDVAAALVYLHERDIVHGGLHASNVLIGDEGGALLGDGGLAPFVTEVTSGMALSGNPTMRYLSPEIHDPGSFGFEKAERSKESDIYSFGMLAIELYTRQLPFADIKNDNSVAFAALEGKRPSRPEAKNCPGNALSDAEWELVQRCWCQIPTERPTAEEVLATLREISV